MQKNKKSLKIPLIITISLLVISTLSFLYLYFFTGTLENLKVFNVSGIDPILAEELTGSIVYTTDQLSDSIYFSDSLQATMKVNQELFNVSESPGRIHFSSKGGLLFQFSSSHLRLIEEDVKKFAQKNLFYDDLTLVTEKEDDDIGYILYSYSLGSAITEKLPTSSEGPVEHKGYITVMYRTVDDGKVAYLEIVGLNYEEDKPVNQEFINILKSLSFDIEGIEQEITTEMGSGDVIVKYDRSSWNLINLTDYSISLNDKVNNDNTVLITSLKAIGYSNDDDISEYLYKQAEDKLSETKNYQDTTENVFEQIGEPEIVEVNNQDFVKTAYDITYKNGIKNRSILYYGLLTQKGNLITINIKSGEYNENSIALIDSILDSIELKDQQINSLVLGTASVSINPTTVLGQASTVKIYVSKCVDVVFSNNLTNWHVNGKQYKVCSQGTGSGFVIDNKGHIVTNAHVASPNNLDLLFSGNSTDGMFEQDFSKDIIELLVAEYGPTAFSLSEDQLYSAMIEVLLTMNTQNLFTITPNNPTLYIQGTQPFLFNQYTFGLENKSFHYPANLIKHNEITSSFESHSGSDVKMADVPDLALIKIEGNFLAPSLPIRPEGIVPGQSIFVVGYPGIAESNQMSDTASVTPSTVTQGTISAIKPNSNATFDIIQIDASVSGGNSGGPIISEGGYVIGVATYATTGSSSGNYNIGVKADSVENFLSSEGIVPMINEERELLEEALLDISNSYYSTAYDKLLNLITNEPSLSITLTPFIELCDVKIEAGEDKTPSVNLGALTVITIILSAILICFLTILIVLIKNRKKSTTSHTPVQSTPENSNVQGEVNNS